MLKKRPEKYLDLRFTHGGWRIEDEALNPISQTPPQQQMLKKEERKMRKPRTLEIRGPKSH